MLRFITKLSCFYISILIIMSVGLVVHETQLLHGTYTDMANLIQRGNRYCTQQTQDIDIVLKQINTNSRSKLSYQKWLDCVENGKGFRGLTTTSTGITTPGIAPDKNLKDIIEFLKSNQGDGYSPLNFGMTYLDPVKLEQDMKHFLVKNIRDFDRFLTIGRFGFYRVDPYTIDVKVSLDMEPVDISNILTDATTRSEYVKIFGLDVNNVNTSEHISKSELTTLIKYNITYYVKWDYIPTSVYFRVNQRKVRGMVEQPDNIYFPMLYDAKGNLNPNPNMRTAFAQYKLTTDKPFKYTYSYILTH